MRNSSAFLEFSKLLRREIDHFYGILALDKNHSRRGSNDSDFPTKRHRQLGLPPFQLLLRGEVHDSSITYVELRVNELPLF